MSYLEARNITKKYNGTYVLRDLSLSAEQGEMIAIMGKTGCGKSTLLHILAGIEKMDSGSYVFHQKNMSNLKDKEMAELRNREIGYILQSYALIGNMTAYENIILPLQMRKIVGNETYQIVEKISNRLGIVNLLDEKAKNLSGGEKQRIAIARALVINPKIILADEPTGNLDSENTKIITELFQKLNEEYGTTFIIVTHEKNLIEHCMQVIRLKDGEIVNE